MTVKPPRLQEGLPETKETSVKTHKISLTQNFHKTQQYKKEMSSFSQGKKEVQVVTTQIVEHPAQIGQPIFARNVKMDGTFFV